MLDGGGRMVIMVVGDNLRSVQPGTTEGGRGVKSRDYLSLYQVIQINHRNTERN